MKFSPAASLRFRPHQPQERGSVALPELNAAALHAGRDISTPNLSVTEPMPSETGDVLPAAWATSQRQVNHQGPDFRRRRALNDNGQILDHTPNWQIVRDGDYPRHGQTRFHPLVRMLGNGSEIVSGQDTICFCGKVEHGRVFGALQSGVGSQEVVQVWNRAQKPPEECGDSDFRQ